MTAPSVLLHLIIVVRPGVIPRIVSARLRQVRQQVPLSFLTKRVDRRDPQRAQRRHRARGE